MSEKNPAADSLKQFEKTRFLLLETFRRNGNPVRTPTFFAKINDLLYISTLSNTGKVKRLRSNNKVRVAPTNFRGRKVLGDWIEGRASLVEDPGVIAQVNTLLNRQHPILRRLRAFAEIFSRPKRVVYSIDSADGHTKKPIC